MTFDINDNDGLTKSALYFSDDIGEVLPEFGNLDLAKVKVVKKGKLGYTEIELRFGDAYKYVRIRVDTFRLGSLKLPDEIKAHLVMESL